MDLVGSAIEHKSYGIGIITSVEGNRISVEFPDRATSFFVNSNYCSFFRFLDDDLTTAKPAMNTTLAGTP